MPPVPTGCASAGGVGERHAPCWEVADIFRHSGDAYRNAHPMPPAPQKVMHDIVACRTAPLGGHAEQCPHGGFERYAYHACRHRHGPQCQVLTKAQWREDRNAELLPVPSFPTVLTLPHDLNPLILGTTRPLRTLLFQATRHTLRQCGRQNLGGQLGCTMVLHTWDQTLGLHVPLHCLVAAGALASDGTRWNPTHPRLRCPVQALRTVLRGTCLDALHQTYATGALTCAEDTADLDTPAGFARLLDPLDNKEWGVDAKRPFAGPEQVLDSVGRSTPRVAISTHRLVEVPDGQVRFTSRNRRQGSRVQPMPLEAHELIRRFLLHVFPHGCRRLRPAGFLANRCKARALRQCRQLLGQPSDPPQREKKSAAEWMRQRTGIDMTQCPRCGHGPLARMPLCPLTPPAVCQRDPSPPPLFDSS